MDDFLKPSLDPVEAYDRIAPMYPRLAQQRSAYLAAVNELVISRVPTGSRSLLDVGAGDSTRSFLIAQRTGIEKVVSVEPSAGMRQGAPAGAEIWAVRAEELPPTERRFDVITCLWNVLGHITSEERRILALSKLASMLASGGRLFVDVNHRYNLRSYGLGHTAVRLLVDQIRPDDRHGDVNVTWNLDGTRYATYGHVFTDREFRRLASAAGLAVEERLVVDYRTGQIRRFACRGNLFYVLRWQDSRAVASVSHT